MSPLVATIKDAMKQAMRAKDKQTLSSIRLIQAEFKRIEVDERIEIDDARALAVLDKMLKQRRDSIQQFQDAGRTELAEKEQFEAKVIQSFLPEPLNEQEILEHISQVIEKTAAASMQDMGKVMGILKPIMQGRADMGQVSQLIKKQLA